MRFIKLGLGGAATTGDVGNVTSLVPDVPIAMHDSLALFALRT
jgi:hypothetical protein